MNSSLKYILVAIFAVFIGSQITEAVLLVPYWQSLSANEFYSYYSEFGPEIGRFYTILTIVAMLIPLALAVLNFRSKDPGLRYSMISSFFAIVFVACFYVYFKGTNELFYQSAFNESDLKSELISWSKWHWSRVGLEILSLVFMILALCKRSR